MDDSINETNEEDIPEAKIVAKYEKAHNRGMVGIFTFLFGGQIGVISVSHDSSKLWILHENRAENSIYLDEKMILLSWRNGIQSAEVSGDGQYVVVIGMNSKVYEVQLINSVKNTCFDFGYLESVFCALSPQKTGYLTAAYSGFLKDVKCLSNEVVRQEAFPAVKQISCLKYSRDGKYLAIGQLDGGIELLYAEDFKNYHKYEVHSMRIRKIEFLPGDEQFLTSCDDRLIKLHSVTDIPEPDPAHPPKALRVYSAHDAPVIGLAIDEKSGGTRFASSSTSSQIFIWHIEMTTPIMSVVNDHTSAISALSFSPTSRHLLSGGDDGMLLIYSIPGVGEDSPVYYPAAEDEQQVNSSDDPYYQQENEPPSDYSQPAGHDIYTSHHEEDFAEYQQDSEAVPTAQYQEYNPYAEPRTPPKEDDDDLGDYVYNTTAQPSYEPSSPSHNEYNPAL